MNDAAPITAIFVLSVAVLLIPLVFMVCWNYGISDVLHAFGTPDVNLTYIQSFLSLIGIGLLTSRVNRSSD